MEASHTFPRSTWSTFLGGTAGLTSIKHLLLFKTDFLNFQIILIIFSGNATFVQYTGNGLNPFLKMEMRKEGH